MLLFQVGFGLEKHEPLVNPSIGPQSKERTNFEVQVRESMNELGKIYAGFVPFVTVVLEAPELYKSMKTALEKKDEALFYSSAIMFASLIMLDTADAMSYGISKTATTSARVALKNALENPSASKSFCKIVKENIKDLGKYFPDIKLFKESKAYKHLDRNLGDVFNMMQKGFEKFPNCKAKVLKILESSKDIIPYKHESNLFAILNKQSSTVSKTVKSTFRSMHGQPVAVITIDKGSMWALNALDKSQLMGDTALLLYNRSVIKTQTQLMKKFNSAGLSFNAVRTGSDEIIVVINGIDKEIVKKAAKSFEEALNKNLKDFSSKMNESIQEVFSKVSCISEHGNIHAQHNTFGLTKAGKNQTVITKTGKSPRVYTLSEFSGRSETRQTIKTYIEKFAEGNVNHPDVKYLRELAGSKSKALEVIAEGTPIHGVVGYRVKLNENSQRIFSNVASINEKGVSAVSQNIVGPSVFNQVGHNFVDSLNHGYSEAIIKTAEKYGVKAKVYQSAPMQLAYKFESTTSPEVINTILKESEEIFSKSLRKKGFKEVKTFYDTSTTYISKVSENVNLNFIIASRLNRNVTYSAETISNVNSVLGLHSVGVYTHELLEEIPKHVRNIDDLAQFYVDKGYKSNQISKLIESISDLY